ncbi:hypothetical protein HY501_02885 [Candidatus Woesearchaeota archaeon]|nr:hypothetical protein [Candidatus Woesearchaeota archaeon]
MNRKVIRLGNQAHVLTLPIQWVRENGVSTGDELEISVAAEKLVISAKKQKRQSKTLSINIQSDEFNIFRAALIEAYTLGYDKVLVTTDAKHAKEYLNLITSRYFFGFEVVKQQKNVYEIENISEPELDKFETIFRKLFLLCIEVLKNITEGSIEQTSSFEKLERMEKYNNFCKRSITKKIATLETESIPYLWQILSYLTKFKITSRALLEFQKKERIQLTKEARKILTRILENLESTYTSFYSHNLELIGRVYEKNKDLLLTVTFGLKPKNRKEFQMFSYLLEYQRLISYMTAPITAISISHRYLETKEKREYFVQPVQRHKKG